jgi:hypothetical protein
MSNLKQQLELKKLVEEVIKEVGDLVNIKPYPYKFNMRITGDMLEYIGMFTTTDGYRIAMLLEDISEFRNDMNIPPSFDTPDNRIYQIGYRVEGVDTQHAKTNYSELMKILKTVLDFSEKLIPNLIREYGKDTLFVIASQAKDTTVFKSDSQKDKVYNSIISQNLSSDYKNTKTTTHDGKLALLFKKK